MELRMNGRNALVTGGSKGIGLAIARSFAEAGANVAMVARRQKGLDEARAVIAAAAANTKVVAVAADVGTADGCRTAFAAAEKAFGQIDVLVNNAGTSQRGPFVEITDELWQHDIDLKLFAAIRLCRLALPGMKRAAGAASSTSSTPAPRRRSRMAHRRRSRAPPAWRSPRCWPARARRTTCWSTACWSATSRAISGSCGTPTRAKGRSIQDFYAEMGKRIPMGPRRHGAGVRQHGAVPGLRRRHLCHRHGHQHRRRA